MSKLSNRENTPVNRIPTIVREAIAGTLALTALLCGDAAIAQPLTPMIYWGDRIEGKIYRSDTGGGAIEEIVADAGTPLALAIDPVDRKLYWSNGDTSTLHRANLDGTDAQTLPGSYTSDGLAVDVAGRKLYWTSHSGSTGLRRANLDGSATQFLESGAFHDLTLHMFSNRAYFLRRDSDGTPPFEVQYCSTLAPFDRDDLDIFARAIVVDPVRGEIIRAWSGGRIHRSDLLGNAIGSFFVSNDPNRITEDALDGDGRVYWSRGTGIYRAFRTGASLEQIHAGLADPGPLAVYRETDCNGNGVADVCEITCGTAGGPCDVPGCGTAIDCDRDGLLDVCEPPQDCNGNGTDDRCDLANGTSTDCNLSLIPDECDTNDCNGNDKPDTCDLADNTSDDCNNNSIPDECDIASGGDCNGNQIPDTCESECNNNNVPDECDIASGFSDDCNADGEPDECEMAGNDCNSNSVLDVCDVASETSTDCDANVIPDECELAGRDCNDNGIHDACDIQNGTSQDLDGNGFPDECLFIPPSPPIADPSDMAKVRFISFSIAGSAEVTALRVRMISLHNVVPPYNSVPTVPFDLFEGQDVWVGPPVPYVESIPSGIPFKSAVTQCQPHYQDWSTVGLIHVRGSHIVPSSIYQVQQVPTGCQGQGPDCPFVSTPLEIRTRRWSDLETPFKPPSTTTQPDLADVAALVNKFRGANGAVIKARALITPSTPFGEITHSTMNIDLDFTHISASVDAFRGAGYPGQMGKCANSTTACTNHSDCGANGPCNLYCPD